MAATWFDFRENLKRVAARQGVYAAFDLLTAHNTSQGDRRCRGLLKLGGDGLPTFTYCHLWQCWKCGSLRAAIERFDILAGIQSITRSGDNVWFLTLQPKDKSKRDIKDFSKAARQCITYLKKKAKRAGFEGFVWCLAIGLKSNGAPHLHVLVNFVPSPVPAPTPTYPNRHTDKSLTKMATGLGLDVWFELGTEPERIGGYMTKNLTEPEKRGDGLPSNLRRIDYSQNWLRPSLAYGGITWRYWRRVLGVKPDATENQSLSISNTPHNSDILPLKRHNLASYDDSDNQAKICSRCRKSKPRTSEHFKPSKTEPDGYQRLCLDCSQYDTERNQGDKRICDTKANTHNHHARRRGIAGRLTGDGVFAALQRANGYCEHCHKPLPRDKAGKLVWQIEHLEPLSRGGANEDANIVISCKWCNRAKGDKLKFEWALKQSERGIRHSELPDDKPVQKALGLKHDGDIAT